jgi:hypothetical protein
VSEQAQLFKNGVAVANVISLGKRGGQPILQEVATFEGAFDHEVGVTPTEYRAEVDRPRDPRTK